ncbi:MAG TPA: hypothetical protein VN730_05750 [Steroidobacteraceae bacterium]|nr:hypothetical protein [Steroidobacteraceae bacterium]
MRLDRAISRLVLIGAIAALLGGGPCIWGYLNTPQTFFPAWLAGFYFWLSMPVGAIGMLLIWDLTGGRWGPIARLPLSAMAATMPLFLLIYLPVVAGLPILYPWTHASVAAHLHNGWYLNLEFFFLRAGLYFLIWIGFAAWGVLRRPGPDGGAPAGLQWVSAIGVLLMGYSLTYAGIDWIMSTEPDWFSSIYGMVVGSGQFIAAISCALMLMVLGARAPVAAGAAAATSGSGDATAGRTAAAQGSADAAAVRAADPFTPALASLAAVLVAVIVFWAYTSFCQWLIIWEENLHTEIHWFIERWAPPWGSVIFALAAAQFFVPFIVLVWTPAKRNPIVVGAVCALLLLADLLNVWWLVLPGFERTAFSWLDPAAMICIGGLWMLAAAGGLRFCRDRTGGAHPEATHA